MSKEVRLTNPCTHLSDRERVFLGPDRRSLRTSKTVASSKGLKVYANDIEVPSIGLHSQAELFSGSSGPFRILKHETNLTIQTSGETLSYTLPISAALTTDQLVSLLAPSAETTLFENDGGFLRILDLGEFGRSSRIQISGNALCALGFSLQKGSKGAQVFPAWDLATSSELSARLAYRSPKFRDRVKSNPIFKTSYTFHPEQCLRCGGSLRENDYSFNTYGDTILIENENLLHQAALKILLTTKGSNPYNPWYGTTLRKRIGSKAINTAASLINEDVRSALEKVKSLQVNQKNFQEVTFKERIYRIDQVKTRTHAQDPTMFLVDVVVTNASQDPVNLSVIFTVPGVAAKIMGSDGFLKTSSSLEDLR